MFSHYEVRTLENGQLFRDNIIQLNHLVSFLKTITSRKLVGVYEVYNKNGSLVSTKMEVLIERDLVVLQNPK